MKSRRKSITREIEIQPAKRNTGSLIGRSMRSLFVTKVIWLFGYHNRQYKELESNIVQQARKTTEVFWSGNINISRPQTPMSFSFTTNGGVQSIDMNMLVNINMLRLVPSSWVARPTCRITFLCHSGHCSTFLQALSTLSGRVDLPELEQFDVVILNEILENWR